MRLRKRMEELETRVWMLELGTRRTERETKKRFISLECPHTELRYGRSFRSFCVKGLWVEECTLCGKEIRRITDAEYLGIQKDKLTSELKDVKAEITAAKKE